MFTRLGLEGERSVIRMKFGDQEGLNKIYTSTGEIISSPDENLLAKFKGECKSWVIPTKKGLSVVNRIFFNGTFYVTNKRIIFIAEPQKYSAGMLVFPGASHVSTNYDYVMVRSNLAYESGGRMYFYFNLNELKNIKTGALSSIIKLKDSKNQSIRIAIDKKSGKYIKDYLAKRLR